MMVMPVPVPEDGALPSAAAIAAAAAGSRRGRDPHRGAQHLLGRTEPHPKRRYSRFLSSLRPPE